ncbi:C-type mannose receptor 2-like isoform X2 [Ictalurus furcatus]|uniref:C-type mannose receptor 2-like isoform X2 n=1 Tax=Ictalurus furcatus TaxID=66913 RepID=UPI002351000D|nr:C-type mannose receptor 2-like isoform X2 [Ictalurus furcatus]
MKTWNDALAYCRASHTDLAIIKSSDDMVRLQNEAQRQRFSSEAWIGLYNDINSWRWSFDNEPLGFEDWDSFFQQPNNRDGHEECVAAFWHGGWYDAPCDTVMPFVCFDARNFAASRYIYISKPPMNWSDAQSYCRQHYTDLAIIKNSIESVAFQNILTTSAWLGLFRDSWKWINETNMSTVMWAPGQPDNRNDHEDCGFVTNGQAADAPCSDTKPFFCYSDITGRKQTIRVKIQSKQDVNDPAFKAAILEKIKEKLMDHGMPENTTVNWLKQPGGVVFHKEEYNNNINNNNDTEKKTKESSDL